MADNQITRIEDAMNALFKARPDLAPVECTEYDSLFVFKALTDEQKSAGNVNELYDILYGVNKKTGVVAVFNPMNIPADEYKNGKKVTIPLVHSFELYHHGIKGQRWGIRRFQNKDGSLTNAGKKRRARLEAELSQLKGKKTSSKSTTKSKTEEAAAKPRKKTVAEMTDDEVRERIARMQLEKNYYDTAKSLAQANPKKVSAGKRFLNSLGKDVLAPAAISAGKAWAENFMKEKLGLNKKEHLKDQFEILDYQKKIKALKNDIRDLDDDELSGLKKKHDTLDYQKKIEKLEKGEPSLKEIVSELNSLSSAERDALVTAAGIKYYEEAVKGKGAKPDKGDKKDKKDDDD